MVKTIEFLCTFMGCPSGTSMKFGRNNTTEKSVSYSCLCARTLENSMRHREAYGTYFAARVLHIELERGMDLDGGAETVSLT